MKIFSSMRLSLRKLLRFTTIYGPGRALIKAAGRLRIRLPHLPSFVSDSRVGVIGCGQFAFSTIAYFLRGRATIVSCFDISANATKTFANEYGAVSARDAIEVFNDTRIETVYIASNHASHTDYALAALVAGKQVYVEKPVAVSLPQLTSLHRAARVNVGRIFAGYNRPFSGAIRDLRSWLPAPSGPLTLSCFISGHQIPPDHWYRHPVEGTRICGNVGHWLDLAVHMLHWRGLPDAWKITLAWSDPEARDDDLSITLTSESGDLINIVLTARNEPFEGINETLNVQWDEVIAKIDDFRKMTIWNGEKLKKSRYWPKDVGHKRAVLQPFRSEIRPWSEVELSSLLMLHITDMVRTSLAQSDFSFANELSALREPESP